VAGDGARDSTHAWDVFLCHSSADKARVERLAEALVARGVRVWFDKTALTGSPSIPLAIEDGLERSRTLVLCLSPAFLESEWTAYERASSLYADPTNARSSLLLLELKACTPPRALAHFKRIDFRRYSDRRVDEIISTLELPGAVGETEPDPVARLLEDVKERERRNDYAGALALARSALELAMEADGGSATRMLARARSVCSHALLLTERDLAEAWTLADLAVDATALEGYPELLFAALVGKAEAAMATGRIQVAQGAVVAARELAQDDSDERVVLQLRGQLALVSGAPREAVDLYRQAADGFLAELSRDFEAADRKWTKVGIGSCLSNMGIAQRASGDIAAATITFSKAADWYAQAGSPIDESVARRFLARCHFDEQEWDFGWEALDRAQALVEAADFARGTVACLELRARAFATTGESEQARTALLRALATVESNDDKRRFHQMLATLATDGNEHDVAREHLEQARLLAARGGDPLKIADVAHQLERVGSDKRTSEPASAEILAALGRKLRETEQPAEIAHTMQQLAGAHRSQGNHAKAREWFSRAHEAATGIADHALAASALIGMAEIALVEDRDDDAEPLLREALTLVDRIPAWDVRASAHYFLGRVLARRRELHQARDTLRKAHAIATDHHIDGLASEIDEYVTSIDQTLDLRLPPSFDLRELSDELEQLEGWYPEAQRRLRRFWWYQRGDEVLRNLIGHSGAKALIVAEQASEVMRQDAALATLFDLTTFVAERPFLLEERVLQEFVPIPATFPCRFVNFVGVVKDG
jgi:tetratricopeptide (TPR) repeat protein